MSINGVTRRQYVHRLVAKAFIQIPEKYISEGFTFDTLEVNHNDGDKSNNCVSNLEWSTSSDNKIHAYKMNLSKQGEDSCKSKYTNDQIHSVCKYIEENELGPNEIHNLTGVSVSQIHDIKNNGSWKNISSLYDFSKYTPKQRKYTDNQLQDMMNLLQNKNMSVKEISTITGIKEKSIYSYKSKIL